MIYSEKRQNYNSPFLSPPSSLPLSPLSPSPSPSAIPLPPPPLAIHARSIWQLHWSRAEVPQEESDSGHWNGMERPACQSVSVSLLTIEHSKHFFTFVCEVNYDRPSLHWWQFYKCTVNYGKCHYTSSVPPGADDTQKGAHNLSNPILKVYSFSDGGCVMTFAV